MLGMYEPENECQTYNSNSIMPRKAEGGEFLCVEM
jgi:hypothetical protein